jgi:SAM-dependent MidA family methyltransferase
MTAPFVSSAQIAYDPPEALAISARLTASIEREIEAAGGWIPFSRFMELALYAPGLGYYSAGAAKVGRSPADGSDFVTAPELTPLFARALARPVAEVLADGGTTLVELGGGSGRLAADLLRELESLERLPAQYLLLDVSADFRARQAATLAQEVPHLADRVRWLDALPDRIDGVVLGNEVLDALPVDIVVRHGGGWQTRGVVHGLAFGDREAPADVLESIGQTIPDADLLAEGYFTEVHPAARALVGTIVGRLTDRSAMLLIDYGFPASEYYHPQRSTGTLMAHRRHRASVDLLSGPGLRDLTAHVDFSAVAAAGREAGGSLIGYTSQAAFLIDCGIADLLRGDAAAMVDWAPQAAALQRLLSEAEMGELFKVIGLARGPRDLIGFQRSDRREAL